MVGESDINVHECTITYKLAGTTLIKKIILLIKYRRHSVIPKAVDINKISTAIRACHNCHIYSIYVSTIYLIVDKQFIDFTIRTCYGLYNVILCLISYEFSRQVERRQEHLTSRTSRAPTSEFLI